jgi:hypothetical protein
MRKLFTTKSIAAASVATLTLLALIAAPAAMAQTGTGSPGASPPPAGHEAPVGHRQPRAADVPPEKNLGNPNDPINKEDAALDKKIKSICRGC